MMDSRFSPYGAIFGGKSPMQLGYDTTTRRRSAMPVLVGCLFVPWLLFAATFWLRSFELRRDSDSFANMLCYCLLLPVLAFAWMTHNLSLSGNADSRPMAFLTATSFLAWILAYFAGDWNYTSFMRPFYDISNLNTYPNVDPSKYVGTQLMDAGMIQFTTGSALRLEKSMGFKNEEVYCVAPIVSGTKSNQTTYDFWAIGLNCCSGHTPDFKCGEFSNPSARWGLRLMDDARRAMFRLAVKQAEAAFNLNAPNPVLLYWLADPTAEVNAYQDDGNSYFFMFMFGYFSAQFVLVLCATGIYAKI